MRISRFGVGALGLAAIVSAADASAAPLVQHRAVYDLTLDEADDRTGITGLTGRMVYEFNGSRCEGWTVNFRFVTRIDTGESSRVTDQQTTTFEDAEGKSFSFLTKSFTDSSLEKEVKGTATRGPDRLNVRIDKPEPSELDLQATQFPTQHLEELIDKANAGEVFYETSLFDGSDDGDQVMTTSVVVGKKTDAASDDPELSVLKGLAGDRYWPVDIAYFDLAEDGGEQLPDYRISFKLHENGLTRDLEMDYGDFSMKGRLVDLSVTDAPAQDCN